MSNKYCGKCGNIIREKSKFCSRCGSRILPRVDTLIPTELNSTPSLAERKKWAKISSRPLLKVLLISTVILVTLGWFVLRLPPVRLALYRNSASAEINDLADKSGLNSLGMLYFYSSNPKLVSPDILNKVCPKVDIKSVEYGCYLPSSNDMYILKVTNIEYRQIENVSVAHETLHAIWQDSSPSERTELKKELSAVYNSGSASSKRLEDSIKLYGNDQDVIDNELHSFIGSTVQNAELSSELQNHYEKYFDSRSKPVNANSNFEGKIRTELSDLDSQYSNLIDLSNNIDQFKIIYLDNIKSYMDEIRYYDTYSYNLNVDIYNSNLAIYNRKISQYNSSRVLYNSNVESFNNSILAFYPIEDRAKVLSQ